MNKRKRLLSILVCFFIGLVGLYLYLEQQTQVVVWGANYKVYESVDEIEKDSDLIVIGRPIDKSNHIVLREDGTVEEGYTITKFKINKVISNTTNINRNNIQDISLIEPYFIYDEIIGQKLISIEGYEPMDKQEKYILFLTLNKEGDNYFINGLSQGKHNINGNNHSKKHKYHDDNSDLDKKVLEKFYDDIKDLTNN